MTTTSSFQVGPDFWPSKEEAMRHKEVTITNPYYSNFKQDIFHAGDEYQFQLFRDTTNGEVCQTLPSLSANMFRDQTFEVWDKYKNVEADSVINTFRYIFHKFKKGIFVKIVNNKLRVFLPFSKANFTNEWSHKIEQDPNDIVKMIKRVSKDEGRTYFDENSVNKNIHEWYGNNCLVRYEFPLHEGDSNVGNVKNMLEELCDLREIPDIEFFINRRDFPVLTRDGTEPYNNIWGSKDTPLVSHSYDKYLPILSMSVTERYADVPMPTWDDWARIQSMEGKYFPRTAQDYSAIFDIEWEDKIETAVFRGSTTGCGVDLETNLRLKLVKLSIDSIPKDKDLVPYLDAKLTKWNLRPRKLETETKLKSIDIELLKSKGIDIYKRNSVGEYLLIDPKKQYYSRDSRGKYFPDQEGLYIADERNRYGYKKVRMDEKYISNSLTPKQQSKYKYIVNIDGHVSAFRLSLELSMGSVILLVKSPWKIWYRDLLIEYKHYVPVKEDLSDLIDQIKWCREHDEDCKKIANNARLFFNTYLQKDGVLDYTQKILINLKREMGVYLYNSLSPLDTLIAKEEGEIDMRFPKIEKSISDLAVVPNIERCYGLLQGMEWIVRKVISEANFERIAKIGEQICKNKLGVVRQAELANFRLAIKTTSDPQKIKEHIHEAFIGTRCLNEICNYVPNFAYVFGMYMNEDSGKRVNCNVISEFISGETLSQYIEGDHFSFKEFLFITMQLCLALEVAQNTHGFVHYDLAPWNIVLRRTATPVFFDYIHSHTRVVRVHTACVPVMIDFGKSHVISDGVHHGFVNMFKVSTSQDIITLLVKSLDKIINRALEKSNFYTKLEKEDKGFKNVLLLLNFLTDTKYKPEKIMDLKSASDFLRHARKYSTLVYQNKHELEQRTPFDLVKYIMSMGIKFPVGTVDKYLYSMDKGNGRQVFEYAFSNTRAKRIETYVSVFSRLMKSTLPQPTNLFFIYYTVQSLERNLTSVKNNMIEFLKNEKMPTDEYEKIYENIMSFLQKVYGTKITSCQEKDVEYNIDENYKKLHQAPYTEETFLCPKKVLELLRDEHADDLSEYKQIIQMILLDKSTYELNKEHREDYVTKFKELLFTNSLNMKNNIANVKTLRFMSREIYQRDNEYLKSEMSKTKKTCDMADEYLKLYKMIIEKVD